jgi:uncharacterized damage-inducible protein DinB
MNLQPEHAHGLVQFLIADFERESPTTRKVIAAVPGGQEGYAPHERCMTALKLAWHNASADVWFLNSIAGGAFVGSDNGGVPENIKSSADVCAWYDENWPKAVAAVKAMTPDQCAKVIDFFGMMQLPAAIYLQLAIKHSVHHRGQMSAYLRPMGAKVPGIYGPSGDTEAMS